MVPLFSTLISTILSSIARRLVLDRHAPFLRRRLVLDRCASSSSRRLVFDRSASSSSRHLVLDRRAFVYDPSPLSQKSILLAEYPIHHYIPSSFQRIHCGIG